MAEVGLRQYCEEAKELMREGSLDEAIAICRHILKQYPKYIMPYRLLGEAALEKEGYEEAANLFTRVLGADPEDVIAHVGLAVVHEERGEQEEAIWHLEWAFELTPGNAEIRQELKRLYGQREGAEPERVKLTPAALGRLYLKEGLYQRAITEFRPLLEADPDRVDLKVALAEALWREDRRREAAETCQEILESLPNCLKANLILGAIWRESGQEEEGETLLLQAQALDPENSLAQELFGEGSPLPAQEVHISRLEEMPPLPVEMLEEAPPAEEEEPPEWLRRLQAITAAPEEREPTVEEAPEAEEVLMGEEAAPEEEIPEWLRALREAHEEKPPEAPPPEEEVPEWLKGLIQEAEEVPTAPPGPSEEIPEWLQRLEEVPKPVVEEAAEEEVPEPAPAAEEAEVEVEEVEEVAPEPLAEEVVEEIAPPELAVEAPEEAEEIPTIEGYLERLAADPKDHQARLELARAYLAQGESEEALTHYRRLVRVQGALEEVLEDLEAAAQELPYHLPTQQLLGYAYMKSGRLDEALETYRLLREKLKR